MAKAVNPNIQLEQLVADFKEAADAVRKVGDEEHQLEQQLEEVRMRGQELGRTLNKVRDELQEAIDDYSATPWGWLDPATPPEETGNTSGE